MHSPEAGPGPDERCRARDAPVLLEDAASRVLAHRGLITAAGEDSGVWENSAAAFAAAHAAGIDYIETDCQVTADGDVVLFHDETLTRLVGDSRSVRRCALESSGCSSRTTAGS